MKYYDNNTAHDFFQKIARLFAHLTFMTVSISDIPVRLMLKLLKEL